MPITFKTPDLFKEIDPAKTYVRAQTVYSAATTFTGIDWSYATKEAGSYQDELRHLFASCGMSFKFFSDAEYYPVWEKLANLRASNIVVGAIPQSAFTTSIAGQTVTVTIPTGTTSGVTGMFTAHGATFDSVDNLSTPLQGQDETFIPTMGPIVWLFSDEVATPYQGPIDGGRTNPNSGITSWSGHPVATPYWRGDTGNDTPVGFILLDKGLIVFTNTSPVDEVDWSSNEWGPNMYSASTWNPNASESYRKAIRFDQGASITFQPKGMQIEQTYFCHAEPDEFVTTFNETYNNNKAYYKPDLADPLWITDVALLNDDDEIIAFAKLSEPVRKDRFESLVFKVSLKV